MGELCSFGRVDFCPVQLQKLIFYQLVLQPHPIVLQEYLAVLEVDIQFFKGLVQGLFAVSIDQTFGKHSTVRVPHKNNVVHHREIRLHQVHQSRQLLHLLHTSLQSHHLTPAHLPNVPRKVTHQILLASFLPLSRQEDGRLPLLQELPREDIAVEGSCAFGNVVFEVLELQVFVLQDFFEVGESQIEVSDPIYWFDSVEPSQLLDHLLPDGIASLRGCVDSQFLDSLARIELAALDESVKQRGHKDVQHLFRTTREHDLELEGIGGAANQPFDLRLQPSVVVRVSPLPVPFLFEQPDCDVVEVSAIPERHGHLFIFLQIFLKFAAPLLFL